MIRSSIVLGCLAKMGWCIILAYVTPVMTANWTKTLLDEDELYVRIFASWYHSYFAQATCTLIYYPHPPSMEPVYEHLLPRNWDSVVQAWLDEDIPGFDIGGYVVGSKEETAVLYGKTDGIMAGRPFFERVFTLLRCKVRCDSNVL